MLYQSLVGDITVVGAVHEHYATGVFYQFSIGGVSVFGGVSATTGRRCWLTADGCFGRYPGVGGDKADNKLIGASIFSLLAVSLTHSGAKDDLL